MTEFVQIFDVFLSHSCDHLEPSRTKEAMLYSLLAGGKRVRPMLIQSIAQKDPQDTTLLTVASALEMIHTYSLIHDDLPCMDNDDLRRGKPTCHVVYGEAVALLAGDGLLTEAFNRLSNLDISAETRCNLVHWFSKAAGANGMILGQDLDMLNDLGNPLTSDQVITLYERKTGALFGAALVAGSLINGDRSHLDELYHWGYRLGFLFQVQDDCLELSSESQTLGKSLDSDARNAKLTWLKRFGYEEAIEELEKGFESLKHDIISSHSYPHLIQLIETLQSRTH